MARIWSEESKLETWLRIELAALDAWAEVGAVPEADVRAIRERVVTQSPARVAEIERVTDHDLAAFVDAVAEQLGPEGRDAGAPIEGIEEAERDGAHVFHAGTAVRDGRLVTNGGRILSVTATGDTVPEAREAAYAAVERIDFAGARYRRDVAGERGQRVGR